MLAGNLFRLKKENKSIKNRGIGDIRNLFRLKIEKKAIKNRIIGDIRKAFEHEEEQENYYKPKRVGNFLSNNYIEYESNVDRNKTLSVEKCLNKLNYT